MRRDSLKFWIVAGRVRDEYCGLNFQTLPFWCHLQVRSGGRLSQTLRPTSSQSAKEPTTSPLTLLTSRHFRGSDPVSLYLSDAGVFLQQCVINDTWIRLIFTKNHRHKVWHFYWMAGSQAGKALANAKMIIF